MSVSNLQESLLRNAVILLHKLECLCVADDLQVRILCQDTADHSGMVWLHMVDNQIVQLSSIQQGFYLAEEVSVRTVFHGVDQDILFVFDYV